MTPYGPVLTNLDCTMRVCRYLSGTREFTTDVYADGRLVGPATFMWAATLPRIPATVTTVYNNRQLLVRVHPTIAKVVNLAVTRLVASWTDEGDLVSKAYEKEFVTFELTGRRATEVLKAVLKPVLATDLAKKAVRTACDADASVSNLSMLFPRL